MPPSSEGSGDTQHMEVGLVGTAFPAAATFGPQGSSRGGRVRQGAPVQQSAQTPQGQQTARTAQPTATTAALQQVNRDLDALTGKLDDLIGALTRFIDSRKPAAEALDPGSEQNPGTTGNAATDALADPSRVATLQARPTGSNLNGVGSKASEGGPAPGGAAPRGVATIQGTGSPSGQPAPAGQSGQAGRTGQPGQSPQGQNSQAAQTPPGSGNAPGVEVESDGDININILINVALPAGGQGGQGGTGGAGGAAGAGAAPAPQDKPMKVEIVPPPPPPPPPTPPTQVTTSDFGSITINGKQTFLGTVFGIFFDPPKAADYIAGVLNANADNGGITASTTSDGRVVLTSRTPGARIRIDDIQAESDGDEFNNALSGFTKGQEGVGTLTGNPVTLFDPSRIDNSDPNRPPILRGSGSQP